MRVPYIVRLKSLVTTSSYSSTALYTSGLVTSDLSYFYKIEREKEGDVVNEVVKKNRSGKNEEKKKRQTVPHRFWLP